MIPPPLCDYLSSGDNEILKGTIGFEWENPGSMNTSYGYNRNDQKWHSEQRIASITLLGSDEKVKWSQDGDELTLSLPVEAPGGTIATFRVELRR